MQCVICNKEMGQTRKKTCSNKCRSAYAILIYKYSKKTKSNLCFGCHQMDECRGYDDILKVKECMIEYEIKTNTDSKIKTIVVYECSKHKNYNVLTEKEKKDVRERNRKKTNIFGGYVSYTDADERRANNEDWIGNVHMKGDRVDD